MKLRFSIHYHTEWGQQLAVDLSLHYRDGAVKTQHLTMLTDDGELWHVETAVVEARQSTIESFTYLYIVEDADGKMLRREWNLVPRCYACDPSKNYSLPDEWRDMPLPLHLYSLAYAVTRGKTRRETVEPLALPLFRRTIVFRVSAPQLEPGQSVAVVGSHPVLGSWNPSRYLPMSYAGQGEWLLSLNADALSWPLEYKYVVIDGQSHELLQWEEGDNREGNANLNLNHNHNHNANHNHNHNANLNVNATPNPNTKPTYSVIAPPPFGGGRGEATPFGGGRGEAFPLPEGEVLVLYGQPLRISERIWRGAGVSVPVFGLRSEESCGVGDFGDLYRFVDWVAATGMKVIQLLPVNDTTVSRQWGDSHPYNIVSAFALHPHYIDLRQLGDLRDKARMTAFRRQQRELNALDYSDYEAVGRVKADYVQAFFAEQGQRTLVSQDYKDWCAKNESWLVSYVEWISKTIGQEPQLTSFIQYHLHCQLSRAVDYAHSKGIFLKGDLPIGVKSQSVETEMHAGFFHTDSLAGTPPDSSCPQGSNWGFPTYEWSKDLVGWMCCRLQHLEQYFDALRFDHILGYFRIWEIPSNQLFATMGHFSPALPLTSGEIEYMGLPFRRDFLTRPFVNDRIVERLFGIHAQYVRDTFLVRQAYGLYQLKDEVSTQQKVYQYFEGRGDENSLWIRDGLCQLVANVLFLEDPRQADMFHPRIMAWQEPVFEALSNEERDAYMRIYNNFFYQRHTMFWGRTGYDRLSALLDGSRLLACAEDLGQMPECVAPVLDALRILTLEIQQMPKLAGQEFSHLDGNPVRSVCTITTHDMAPLRLWWQENPERTQRYYATMLQKQGRAPEQLPPHLAEEIIARHVYSPSMLCILSLQDWLAMDQELRSKLPRQERINTPADPFNRWQWRMHLNIEQLLQADRYNQKLKTMITRSKR